MTKKDFALFCKHMSGFFITWPIVFAGGNFLLNKNFEFTTVRVVWYASLFIVGLLCLIFTRNVKKEKSTNFKGKNLFFIIICLAVLVMLLTNFTFAIKLRILIFEFFKNNVFSLFS